MCQKDGAPDRAPYLKADAPIDERVEDLLQRMTIEEKCRQMVSLGDFLTVDIFAIEDRKMDFDKLEEVLFDSIFENGELSVNKAKKTIGEGIGQISIVGRYCEPEEGARRANSIQKFAKEETRLGIPIIIHDECLHGCMAFGSTSFPQAIALASTWDDELMEEVAAAIGREARSRGIRQCLSPTINIARDPRCGRTEETYGEDPYLTARMAVAFVRGVQGQGVVATPKHFVANFVGDGGRDSQAIHLSERILREVCFPAFKACVTQANALSIMAAYNSLDGTPCSSNRWLLTEILRKEWGFKGIVVSDYHSVTRICEKHGTARDKAAAAMQAVEAGMDVELPHPDCYEELVGLIAQDRISIRAVDECVRRILRVKFWTGLFDEPYVDPQEAKRTCDCAQHRQLSLRAAQRSAVLLKNENRVLPIGKDVKKIAVIGPNADAERLGGYSGRKIHCVTALQGLRNRAAKNVAIEFAQGCDVAGRSKAGFGSAVNVARTSDVVVLVMGNDESTEGESRDRCDLDLPGVQEDLIEEICNAGNPVVVVLIGGSVVTMSRWIDRVQAVIEAWYPGEEGGNAIADVIFGNCNPSGRLPMTFAKITGQLPLYYNFKPSGRIDDYVDLRGQQPQFDFGYGLSYSTFKYGRPRLQKSSIHRYESTAVTVAVTNTGKKAGDEVVQLYIRDKVSSVVRPVKELKGFRRVHLKPGETQSVTLEIREEQLAFYDIDMLYVVEPGDIEIMVGSSSRDEDLQTVVLSVKP